jgi:hypothetical protein
MPMVQNIRQATLRDDCAGDLGVVSAVRAGNEGNSDAI